MKTTILNNDGYKYLVEVNPINYPKEYVHIKFSTEWENARRDGSEQKKFELFLSPKELTALKTLL